MTRLLFDTDVFCKLGVSGLLDHSLTALGLTRSDCARLAALPHMLRRGRLVRMYGPANCEALVVIAESISVAPSADQSWLDELANIETIDAGEAQLYGVAAAGLGLVLSGDKRALLTLRTLERYCLALRGRIITFEAILLVLSRRLGVETLRQRLALVSQIDKMVGACFSRTNANPVDGLLSYYRSLAREVAPLDLWCPEDGGFGEAVQ